MMHAGESWPVVRGSGRAHQKELSFKVLGHEAQGIGLLSIKELSFKVLGHEAQGVLGC